MAKTSGQPVAPPTEELTDDQRKALLFSHRDKYEAALKAKKEADAALRNVCKTARSDLGESAIDEIKLAIKLDADDGDEAEASLKRDIETKLRVARYMGATLGTQFEFFDGPDRTPSVDRAYEAGKRAGLKGEVAKPPHAPETEQHRRWMEGHADGNAVLVKTGIKPLQEAKPSFQVVQ